MLALKVTPRRPAERIEIQDELSCLQAHVEGWIEMFAPFDDNAIIICNEEGKLNGMLPNRPVWDDNGNLMDMVYGPFLVVGEGNEGDIIALTEEQATRYEKYFG